jgi:predicted dehydrogenase
MKKKVAIIGIGALGEGMVKVFAEHPEVELVAVCDTNTEKVKQCVALYHVEGFTNHHDLLIEMEVDMVYVAVPPKWHHDIAIDVMRAGKHILCEKPLANSLEEAENLFRIAKEGNLVHAMNFPLHYLNHTRKFETLYKDG